MKVCVIVWVEKFRCDGKVESLKKNFRTKLGPSIIMGDLQIYHRFFQYYKDATQMTVLMVFL